MARVLAVAALLLSMAVFFSQLFFFTDTDEQVICGVVGIVAYVAAVATGRRSRSSRIAAIGWAAILGVILGVLPPRLRLGGGLHTFVLFFPLVHAVLLAGFLNLLKPSED